MENRIEDGLLQSVQMSEDEYASFIRRFVKDGKLTAFPGKQKPRIALYIYLARMFDYDKEYSEFDVNCIVKKFYADDFSTLRRALVDCKLLGRNPDGSKYNRIKCE